RLCMLRCMAVSESLTSTINTPSLSARAVLNLATSAPTMRGHSSTASARLSERFIPLRRKSSLRRSLTGFTPSSRTDCRLTPHVAVGGVEQRIVPARRVGAADERLGRTRDEVEEIGPAGGVELGGEVVDEKHGRLPVA